MNGTETRISKINPTTLRNHPLDSIGIYFIGIDGIEFGNPIPLSTFLLRANIQIGKLPWSISNKENIETTYYIDVPSSRLSYKERINVYIETTNTKEITVISKQSKDYIKILECTDYIINTFEKSR